MRCICQDEISDQVNTVVFMENISSYEYFLYDNGEKRPVLTDITLSIKKGEAWGITGRSNYEMRLLLAIMANIVPYNKGKCALAERGMTRRKKLILRHVFYMCTPDMPYGNMNVLEFLVFAMRKRSKNTVELQDKLFEFLIDIGLGYLSLTLNKVLTREERAVVTLVAAAFSDSVLVVFNFPEYDFNDVLVNAIGKISSFMRENGKSLVLCTRNCTLIERACSHTAVIADGRIIYQGVVREFCVCNDNVVVIIRDKNIKMIHDRLSELLPDYRLSIKDESLLISTPDDKPGDPGHIFKVISEAGIYPEHIEVNPKKVSIAIEELFSRYDLQDKLL